jgi:lipopolysaccharide export system permease protein
MRLKTLINNFNKSKIYKHEFSSRFALPFASVIMAIFGMTLGSFFSRTGKSFGIFIAIALVFVYNSIFIISKNLDFINPFLSPWLANIFFGIIAIIYFRKAAQ